MDASSSEDEVFVGATTSAEKKVRAARNRRQTETFTPNFRQRLRDPAVRAVASETEKQPESPSPIIRLDFDDMQSSPVDSPPVVRPFLAKVSKSLFSAPWLSDENSVPTSEKSEKNRKSDFKRCAEELGKKVSIQLHKPGRSVRKRANPSSNTLAETLDQARQLLQRQEDELCKDNADQSLENVGDCLELLTTLNTAENAAFSVVVPTVTPQSTPVSGRVRFGSYDDGLSSGLTKRKSPRIADNLHKSILKANHATHVAQMNAASRSTAESMRAISNSSTDSMSQTTNQASHVAQMNAAFCFTAVRALSSSSTDSTSSSSSLATPTRFPNLLSRIMARRC